MASGGVQVAQRLLDALGTREPYSDELRRYIENFNENGSDDDLLNLTGLSVQDRKNLRAELESLYPMAFGTDEQKKELDEIYNIHDFDDVSVDELRESIETFNNLIVRLPSKTTKNLAFSKNIFHDWKEYVNGSIDQLELDGKLYRMRNGGQLVVQYGKGTDGVDHPYVEVFTDPGYHTPLVDYSYIKYDDKGIPDHDRFDYWTDDDFVKVTEDSQESS